MVFAFSLRGVSLRERSSEPYHGVAGCKTDSITRCYMLCLYTVELHLCSREVLERIGMTINNTPETRAFLAVIDRLIEGLSRQLIR